MSTIGSVFDITQNVVPTGKLKEAKISNWLLRGGTDLHVTAGTTTAARLLIVLHATRLLFDT